MTSRLAQSLVPGVRHTAAAAVVAALTVAASCKGGASKPPCEEPQRVQVLLRTSDRANVGENGQSWPTMVVIYQLSGNSVLEELDADALKEQGEQALGEEYLDKKELTAFPTTAEKIEMQLKPKATHLLVVAQFRQPIGTAWYTSYAIPSGLRDAQCNAAASDDPIPQPCVYLAIEGSEMLGGKTAPANYKVDEFGVQCSVIAPPPKKKKKKKASLPDVPDAPKDPTPKAPTTPSTPTQPTGPKAPVNPLR